MLVPFKYYLHDNMSRGEAAEVILPQLDEAGVEIDEDRFIESIGRPFYEVTLNCLLDTETFEVTIESVEA